MEKLYYIAIDPTYFRGFKSSGVCGICGDGGGLIVFRDRDKAFEYLNENFPDSERFGIAHSTDEILKERHFNNCGMELEFCYMD